MSEHPDWNTLTLVTPKDNERTIIFYTERFGFIIVGEEDDAAVTWFWLRLSRKESFVQIISRITGRRENKSDPRLNKYFYMKYMY